MYEDSSRDMKVDLMPGIASMSGKLKSKSLYGKDMIFKTYRRPDGKTETRAYFAPKGGYKRKTPLSDSEIKTRQRFAQAALFFVSLPEETKLQYAREMKAAKYKFNGKEYKTLRGYIVARWYTEQGC